MKIEESNDRTRQCKSTKSHTKDASNRENIEIKNVKQIGSESVLLLGKFKKKLPKN